MKLNLWQWLGVALLIVGAVLLAIKYSTGGNGNGNTGGGNSAPTSQPATDQRAR
jgi:hypothetical protein